MIYKAPVRIRRNVESFGDPYLNEESLEENTVCTMCGSIYTQGRWYTKSQLPDAKAPAGEPHKVKCPACRKQRDGVPGGVLTISGDFFWKHEEEIMNLIRNQAADALGINPLERVMSLETVGSDVELKTTNEALAQRIGKALHKAYSGHVEYKWSHDTKLARVTWFRQD